MTTALNKAGPEMGILSGDSAQKDHLWADAKAFRQPHTADWRKICLSPGACLCSPPGSGLRDSPKEVNVLQSYLPR